MAERSEHLSLELQLQVRFRVGLTTTSKLAFTASLRAWRSELTGQCDEQAGKFTSYAVGKRHLAGFPHLGVVDRWLVTPKRARYSALVASS